MLYTDSAIKRRQRKKAKIKRRLIAIVYIFLVPLLIYNTSLIVQAIINPSKTPNFLGIKTYVIISGSMRPELEIGDIVVTKNVEQEELEEGDIISFREGQNVVTHRIVEKVVVNGEEQYKTKGDNNNVADSGTISYELMEGKAIAVIPNIGKIALLLQDKMTIIVILTMIYLYISHTKKMKDRTEERRTKRVEYEKYKPKH